MTRTDTIPLRADLDYLLAPANAWWQWSRDGRWIEWADGRTIAAREELLAVIERLAPHGLPPIGSILMLLAATRANWNADTATRQIVSSAATLDAGEPLAGTVMDGIIQRRLQSDVADVCGDLASIVLLPKQLKEPIAAKTALADFVFEGASQSVGPSTASGIIALFGEGFDAHASVSGSAMQAAKRVDLELSALRPGLARVQTEDLNTWLKTGLDALVKPAELNVPIGKQIRALLAELREDRELSTLARIASQLLAVLHVPRVLRAQEELPLGGVSDIANRGSLERLLISELAHDSLTLAVRIAMNEALYLRREAPASHPPIARTVIIDGGIHMWGVPRLFGCAVGMALAATADPTAACAVLRTRGREVEPIDFTSRAGLQEQLAHLTPWPDPADASASASERRRRARRHLVRIVRCGRAQHV